MIWNLLDPRPVEKPDQAAEVAAAVQATKISDNARASEPNTGRDVTQAPQPESSAASDDAQREPAPAAAPNEVDYVKKCTRLYKSIEEATTEDSWGPIITFLDSGVWPNSGIYGENIVDPITPAEQAKTWVTRFAPDDDQKVLWSQLPLHLAIVCDAPFSVIGRLIELYPQAVRCTDDQHMLPIHLALRHNASDDVVAYLLMQFPESVNAKGKDGRLPVDCALRAESKVRGKILEIFVKKTKAKSSKVVAASGVAAEKEILSLMTQLEAKTLALENAESKLAAMEKMKDEIEMELLRKQSEVKVLKDRSAEEAMNKDAISDMADSKLMGDLEMQTKLEELEEERDEALAMLKKAKETEIALRADLDKATEAVLSSTPGELEFLKNDVKKLNFMLLEKSRRDAQDQINVLREELERSMKQADKKNATELRTMQRTMEELRNAATNTRTKDEINMLKDEVEILRTELKDKEDLNKTRAELEQLKKTIEVELKTTEGKTQAEVAALHKAVKNMRMDELQTKTASQLSKLKKELERVKKELQESDLLRKTKDDIAELNAIVNANLEYATGEARTQLSANAKSLARIADALENNCSSSELLMIRKELKSLRSDIKERQKSESVRKELLELRRIIEGELRNSGGKTRTEVQNLKRALKKLDEGQLHALNSDELSTHKGELESIKEDLERKDTASKIKHDLDEIKLSLQANVKAWNGMNKRVVASLLTTAEDMRSSRLEKMSFKELSDMKVALKELKVEVAHVEQATKTKSDLDQLKSTLEDALKYSEGVTAHELYAMKKVIDSIDVEELEIKNKEEWDMIRTELNALKDDLKTKEAGETLLRKEIEELRGGRSSIESKKKSSKKWRGVFSRFRKGSENESPSKMSRVPERRHDSDDSDVETISPPSVHPGQQNERDSDDHSRSSFFNSLRSRHSIKSPRMGKFSGSRSFKQTGPPTPKGSNKTIFAIDPNTGEVTMQSDQKKKEDVNPLSDAVSV
jgi:hypothetical protein